MIEMIVNHKNDRKIISSRNTLFNCKKNKRE
jgi:hypothetical protein